MCIPVSRPTRHKFDIAFQLWYYWWNMSLSCVYFGTMKSRGSEINCNPTLQSWERRVSYMYRQPYKFGPQKILITTKMQCIWKISIPNKFAKSFDYTSPWQKEKVILWQNVEWNVLCYLIGTFIYNEIIKTSWHKCNATFSYLINKTLWHFKKLCIRAGKSH